MSETKELVAALAPVEAVPVVKPLEWRPTASGYGVEAHTILGKYWVQDGQFWAPNCTVSHPYRTDEAAKAGAQEHFNAAILSAIAHPPAQAGAVTEAIFAAVLPFLRPVADWAEVRRQIEQTLTAALGAQTPPVNQSEGADRG
jgi:hypothetical protein